MLSSWVVKCLLLVGRYQFAGASLAGKESCPHVSTMSDADDSTAGAGTTGDVVVTSGSFGWRLHLAQPPEWLD
jgi:hypothetical protein